MTHIEAIGAGVGGMPAACDLKMTLGKGHQVTLINSSEHFQRKMKTGNTRLVYENYVLKALGILRLKGNH